MRTGGLDRTVTTVVQPRSRSPAPTANSFSLEGAKPCRRVPAGPLRELVRIQSEEPLLSTG